MYPSPAGAIESLLSLESWTAIAAEHPALQTMEPDVGVFWSTAWERQASISSFPSTSVIACGIDPHALARAFRRSEVWKEIERFFADLKTRSVKENPAVPELHLSGR